VIVVGGIGMFDHSAVFMIEEGDYLHLGYTVEEVKMSRVAYYLFLEVEDSDFAGVEIQQYHFSIVEHTEPVDYTALDELEKHIPTSVYVHKTFGLPRTVNLHR
jgi:hypothetical protein